MSDLHRRAVLAAALGLLIGCGSRSPAPASRRTDGPAEINRLITKYAQIYDLPESLLHRVVQRESGYNPAARNGPYWGLMQILPQTAKGMGYQGTAQGLLDAETNLKYAGKYLRGAWLLADGSYDNAVKHYSRGYYYEAKKRGMLVETGLVKPAVIE